MVKHFEVDMETDVGLCDDEYESDCYSESFKVGNSRGIMVTGLDSASAEEEEGDAVIEIINESCSLKPRPTKRQRAKARRKANWSEQITNDLVDIICSNEMFQRKLIFTNIKTAKNGGYYEKVIDELKQRCGSRKEDFPYDIAQTREKFKRCISECKKVALTVKTASGIKRFQDENGYGKWFNQLFPLIQTRASCQPEHAIEPSSVHSDESSIATRSNDSALHTSIDEDKREGVQPKKDVCPHKNEKKSQRKKK